MDPSLILDGLNDAQREAVCAPDGANLVLAGAGSGKTRVLIHRIAWDIDVMGASPFSILAVTFTNKAAAEMRGRVENMLNQPVQGMWIGTFHGLCHRLLRQHWKEAALPQGFQIIDSEDQVRYLKRLIRGLELDEAYYPPRQVAGFINHHKEEGRRAAAVPLARDPKYAEWVRIYQTYEDACQRAGIVDFAELLLRAWEMLKSSEPLRAHYQKRFQHILVDEFQDTNSIQYSWLRLLAGGHKNLFVVGDDDQSIYGWRGAKVENILKFERDYPGAKTVRLEQNYRSTGNILKAANAVIDNNDTRLGKNLWTDAGEGEKVRLYAAYNEVDEARYVVDQIQKSVDDNRRRDESAILYRSNAQSRVFEELLISAGMPYRVYGGLRFFERAEIKDALAYLRLMTNRDDDVSFERVVNTPTRGIGNRTVEIIRDIARNNSISMWRAASQAVNNKLLPARAANAVNTFLELIDSMAAERNEDDLEGAVNIVLEYSTLLEHYKSDKSEKAQAKTENLEELLSAARMFEFDEEEGLGELDAFLSHAALEAGEQQGAEWDDCVQLMSLHSAKGLEFPQVFLTGMEEELFPHRNSMSDAGKLEEERRLCYVGMTRAREQLFLSYAESRRLYGQTHPARPSRFIDEITEELRDRVRAAGPARSGIVGYGGAAASAFASPMRKTGVEVANGIKLGSRVRHAKFGDGMVTNYEGSGESARVQVNFEFAGQKWLVLAFANLEVVS
ncbi:MAG: DNA helicase II [Gammaproteobacteria bacterium]|nr:MAG: DNA helicase II [Gammaproteobacteria bacterium]